MESLDKFQEKDMIEQIVMLEDIKEQQRVDLLPALLDIYSDADCDQAVDEMLYHTIFGLLDNRGDDIVHGLDNKNRRIRLLCIRKAADATPAEAKGRLVKELDDGEDEEVTSEILRALSYYKDPQLVPLFEKYITHDDPAVVSWAEDGLEFFRKEGNSI